MITIYQIDKSKLVEIGGKGYESKQKQAWICYDEIPTGDFHINIIDDNVLIQQIGKMVETKFTTNELLLSINNDTENIGMNIYYFNKSANKPQCIQITYSNCPEESNFELSKKILDYIQEYLETKIKVLNEIFKIKDSIQLVDKCVEYIIEKYLAAGGEQKNADRNFTMWALQGIYDRDGRDELYKYMVNWKPYISRKAVIGYSY